MDAGAGMLTLPGLPSRTLNAERSHMEDQKLSLIVKKVFWRIMPILFVSYILAYIDRINIGFASITMNQDLGISAYMYGLAAGVFFWGYVLLEIPSNLMLEKFGARRWIARIMISWGAISACMSLVQGEKSLLIMRFLLGAAEAGFYPGVIVYLTYWFPQKYRARVVAAFTVSLPVSIAIGAPLSTAVLEVMHGIMGMKGWQWLFIVEGVPTVLFGLVFLAFIPNKPADAKWLSDDEREYLQNIMDSEHRAVAEAHGTDWVKALANPKLLILGFIYFVSTSTNLGLAFFLPQMLKRMGLEGMSVGWVTAIPYIFGTIGMLAFAYFSDKYNTRKWAVVVALALIGTGLLGAGMSSTLPAMIAMMCVGAIGIYGLKSPFWALPPLFLTGPAAAVGVAFINSLGNIGGFVGPYAVGWIRESTGAFESGLYFLGALGVAAAVFTILFVHLEKPKNSTASAGAAEARPAAAK